MRQLLDESAEPLHAAPADRPDRGFGQALRARHVAVRVRRFLELEPLEQALAPLFQLPERPLQQRQLLLANQLVVGSRIDRGPDAVEVLGGATSPPPLTVLVDPLPDIWTHFEAAGRGEPRSRVRVGDFRDARKAPFSGTLVAQVDLPRFPAAEIHLSEPAAETIRAAVAHQLRKEGFLLIEADEDWTVSGDLRHFEYAVDGLLRLTRLDVTISVEGRQTNSLVTSRHACAFSSFPLPQDVERSFRGAVEQFLRQIASTSPPSTASAWRASRLRK